jgi:hypothetical protein
MAESGTGFETSPRKVPPGGMESTVGATASSSAHESSSWESGVIGELGGKGESGPLMRTATIAACWQVGSAGKLAIQSACRRATAAVPLPGLAGDFKTATKYGSSDRRTAIAISAAPSDV